MRATTCSSSLNGTIQGVATAALREDARTRQELISTPNGKPTIQQLFEILSPNHLLLEQSSHRQTNSYKKKNIAQSPMMSFSVGLVCGFLWPQ